MKNIGGEVPTNGAEEIIKFTHPYQVSVTIQGTADFLFHRWNCEAVEEKANASKGSKAKKSDNIESYVYRNNEDMLCIPGEYLRQSIIHAAKFKQDPRSPRKSAMDIFKAGFIILNQLASLGEKDWDYVDRRRVVVQRNGITRSRPALNEGWKCNFDIQTLLPEYIDKDFLYEVIGMAGKLIGVGDFRPTYGRFKIINFESINKGA